MKIQLRRLPRSEYPVEPGLYLWRRPECEYESCRITIGKNGVTLWFDCMSGSFRIAELPDGIAWSERLECEVAG